MSDDGARAQDALQKRDVATIRSVLSSIGSSTSKLHASSGRAAVAALCESALKCATDFDVDVLSAITAAIPPRSMDEVIRASDVLARHLESKGRYAEALELIMPYLSDDAQLLRVLSPLGAMDHRCRMARCALETSNLTTAETALYRARDILQGAEGQDTGGDWSAVQQRYTEYFAYFLDVRGRLVDAGGRLHELSKRVADPARQMDLLQRAVVCAGLSSAGPARNRLLRSLDQDDRVRQLTLYATFLRWSSWRLLRREDLAAVEPLLQPHHRQCGPFGMPLLTESLIQHNMEVVARLYAHIRMSHLATTLGVGEADAKRILLTMIGEGRLRHTFVDEAQDLVLFESAATAPKRRDLQIATVCERIANAADRVMATSPPSCAARTTTS